MTLDLPLGPAREAVKDAISYWRKATGMGFTSTGQGVKRELKSEFIREELFITKDDGCLVVPSGFLFRVITVLQDFGLEYDYQRIDRTDTLDYDLSKIDVNSLRPEQIEMLQAVTSYDGGLIVSPTGSGKSYVMREICQIYPDAKIVIAAPSRATVHTLFRYLSEIFPGEVGQVGGGKKFCKRVTISTFRSLLSVRTMDQTDMLLVDEAHLTPADTHAESIGAYNNVLKKMAFTATPRGRYDSAELVMEGLFGPILVDIPYHESVQSGSVVPIHLMVRDQPRGPAHDYLMSFDLPVDRDREAIWNNENRNQCIAQDLAELESQYDQPQILVMVDTVEHALQLKKLLPDYEVVYRTVSKKLKKRIKDQGRDPGELVIPNKRQEEIQRQFESGELKKVISTCFGTGVSSNHCQIIAFCSGSGAMIKFLQSIGRSSRVSDSSKTHGTAIMWKDTFSPVYSNKARRLIDAAVKEGHQVTVLRPR